MITIEASAPAVGSEDANVSLETLECRKNVLENEMFEVAGELGARLHQVEKQVGDLQAALHRLVCLSGGTPIERTTPQVAHLIRTASEALQIEDLEEASDRVAFLKLRVDQLEAAILGRLHVVRDAPEAQAVA